MSLTSVLLIPLCAAAAFVSAANAQKRQSEPEQLSARDMFYHPVKAATAPAGGTPTKGASPGKGQGTTKGAPVEVATAKNTPPQPPVSTSSPTSSVPQTLPGGGTIIQAAVRKAAPPASGQPLGLRYTLVKKGGNDAEVATDTVFHTGDQIQLKIETNVAAYLYIISQGSSGTWKVQVPSADTQNGSNRVEALRPYYFPSSDQAFTFRDPKGTEKLFVLVSREPLADIQDQIYGLQGGGQAKPVAEPEPLPKRQSTLIEARATIPEDRIERMRSMYSRDLIIEKVNPETTGDKTEKKEFAMYVVNPTGSANSRLVADISLVHQ
jgi:hypothetical protein